MDARDHQTIAQVIDEIGNLYALLHARALLLGRTNGCVKASVAQALTVLLILQDRLEIWRALHEPAGDPHA